MTAVAGAEAEIWLARQDAPGFVRDVLAGHLGVAPGELELSRGPHGAPLLAPPFGDLGFSISRSGALVALAVAPVATVGVDLETADREVDSLAIAKRWFHPSEVRRIEALPASARGPRFLQYWTAKEAYVKALGLGLRKPLADFSVAVGDDGDIRLTCDRDASIRGWSILGFAPEGFVGALALHGMAQPGAVRIRYFDGR